MKRRKANHLIDRVAMNIKKFRAAKGLTQEQLEEMTGLTISRYESGRCDMTLTTISILSNRLNIQPHELLQ